MNSEYFTPLLTPMLAPSIPSRSLDATSKVRDIDVKSKFTNIRQEMLDTMKEGMHQHFVTMSEQMSCMMHDKLQHTSPTQESGHVQIGYWYINCGQYVTQWLIFLQDGQILHLAKSLTVRISTMRGRIGGGSGIIEVPEA